MTNLINFVDCTLREGEQTPGVFFSREEKIHLLTLLSKAGVDIADVGMPAVSEDEFKTIKELTRLELDIKIGVSVRAIKSEVDLGLKCGAQEIFLIVPTSQIHLQKKLNILPSKIEELARSLIGRIKGAGFTANFVAEDASRAGLDFIIPLLESVSREGVDRVFICDTLSLMTPLKMRDYIREIRRSLPPEVGLGVHCHNDFGLATANTTVAMEERATFPTGTINGIGERAGNASLQEIVLIAEKLMGLKHRVEIKELVAVSPIVERYSGIIVSQQMPIVGYNVFCHESGIHVDGIIKDRDIYEPFFPGDVGRRRRFVLGKHSGRAHLRYLLKKRGYGFSEDQLSEILRRVKEGKQEQEKKIFSILKERIDDYNEKFLGFPESKFKEIVEEILAERKSNLIRSKPEYRP